MRVKGILEPVLNNRYCLECYSYTFTVGRAQFRVESYLNQYILSVFFACFILKFSLFFRKEKVEQKTLAILSSEIVFFSLFSVQ